MKFLVVIIASLSFNPAALAFSDGPCDRTDQFDRVQTDPICRNCHDKINQIAKKVKMKLSGKIIFVHLNAKQTSSPEVISMAKDYQKTCLDIKGAPELTVATQQKSVKRILADK